MSAALQIFLRSIEGVIKRSQEHVEPELDKKDIPDGTEHRHVDMNHRCSFRLHK